MITKRRGFVFLLALAVVTVLWIQVLAATDADDLQALQNFQKGVASGTALSSWIAGTDPCTNWNHIKCTGSSVTQLLFQSLSLGGTVTPDIQKMKNLITIQFQNNGFTGSLPSLSGLSKLQTAFFGGNSFDTIPGDFFDGLVSLTEIYLDDNPMNGTAGWSLPSGIQGSVSLNILSLGNTSLSGSLPDFLGNMTSLKTLKVSYNMLTGGIPSSFASSALVTFIANNQQSEQLSGEISVVGKMTSLQILWLHVNQFSGPIPSTLSNCLSLQELKLNDNKLVGRIPSSLKSLLSLQILYLRNNDLVGMIPAFPSSVNLTLDGNNFCQSTPGIPCAPDVTSLLDFHEAVGYNSKLANWQLNDPCSSWTGISCGSGKNVTIINLPNFSLAGTISPSLGNLTSLATLILKNNMLTGQIPNELTKLPNLKTVDLSGNQLSGPYPSFSNGVNVNVSNNVPAPASSPSSSPSTPGSVPNSSPNGNGGSSSGNGTNTSSSKSSSSKNTGIIIGMIVAVLAIAIIAVILWFTIFRKKSRGFLRVQSPNTVVVHPRDSGSDPEVVKIVVAGAGNHGNESETQSRTHSGPSEVQVVEAGNLLISIQVLREATKNFSEHSILGRGGFGVVYKGVLDDGTTIAVKRMEAAVVSSKGLNEFQAEIAVLTKVRHRHLVALLGYCIEGNERLLVYEYMPQGTLSQHLFEYVRNDWKPLNWKQRLSIALDVARGMEYLHSLAHKSFIHRDLKPSNILLGDDLRAKVSDFGLVKLAPEGKFSVETRLAGTFGYLAPEYAVTGRVTTKADVFSFGVVLMELITGRRALDETQAEENMHLVAWFRRMSNNKENFRKSIDPAIELNEETLPSITTVAELAGHCTAREPYQRPEMGHAVNILSPLVEKWKPADYDTDENAGIDLDMTLPQALKRWQELDNSYCLDDTQASLPPRPSGFPESFTSEDAR